MYRTVLLAYDGSVAGRTAIREGALLARQYGARVYLLSVVSAGSIVAGDSLYPGAVAKHRESVELVFREALERLRAMGFDPVGRIEAGDPIETIARIADGIAADLVVVGHRRKNWFERLWSGGTTASLKARLGCSLLVAQTAVGEEF